MTLCDGGTKNSGSILSIYSPQIKLFVLLGCVFCFKFWTFWEWIDRYYLYAECKIYRKFEGVRKSVNYLPFFLELCFCFTISLFVGTCKKNWTEKCLILLLRFMKIISTSYNILTWAMIIRLLNEKLLYQLYKIYNKILY